MAYTTIYKGLGATSLELQHVKWFFLKWLWFGYLSAHLVTILQHNMNYRKGWTVWPLQNANLLSAIPETHRGSTECCCVSQ